MKYVASRRHPACAPQNRALATRRPEAARAGQGLTARWTYDRLHMMAYPVNKPVEWADGGVVCDGPASRPPSPAVAPRMTNIKRRSQASGREKRDVKLPKGSHDPDENKGSGSKNQPKRTGNEPRIKANEVLSEWFSAGVDADFPSLAWRRGTMPLS